MTCGLIRDFDDRPTFVSSALQQCVIFRKFVFERKSVKLLRGADVDDFSDMNALINLKTLNWSRALTKLRLPKMTILGNRSAAYLKLRLSELQISLS